MDYESFLQIALAKGVGDIAIRRTIQFFSENQGASWDMLCSDLSMQNLVFKGRQDIIENIASQKEPAKRLAFKLLENDIKPIVFNEEQYPGKLKQALGEKCPPYLFYRGNIGLANLNAVGFCGSRKASCKGITITNDCASQLANNGIVIVSGYAAGVDIEAHKAALMHSGNTVFVLAEGISASSLKKEVKEYLTPENHVFLSQFMPETAWNAGSAMKRNSVIIGLSDAMIIIEAGNKGGTFAAGNEALAMKHPLFVIEYANPEASAAANPHFISMGGMPIRRKNGEPNLSQVYEIIDICQSLNNNGFSDEDCAAERCGSTDMQLGFVVSR